MVVHVNVRSLARVKDDRAPGLLPVSTLTWLWVAAWASVLVAAAATLLAVAGLRRAPDATA